MQQNARQRMGQQPSFSFLYPAYCISIVCYMRYIIVRTTLTVSQQRGNNLLGCSTNRMFVRRVNGHISLTEKFFLFQQRICFDYEVKWWKQRNFYGKFSKLNGKVNLNIRNSLTCCLLRNEWSHYKLTQIFVRKCLEFCHKIIFVEDNLCCGNDVRNFLFYILFVVITYELVHFGLVVGPVAVSTNIVVLFR